MANSLLKYLILEYLDYLIPLILILVIYQFFTNNRKNKSNDVNKPDEFIQGLGDDTDHKLPDHDNVPDRKPELDEQGELKPFLELKDHVPFVGHPIEFEGGVDRFYEMMKTRRSVRHYSTKKIPYEVIEKCILAAGTGPSGVHTQPWTFCVISDPEVKQKVRDIVEYEEYLNYKKRMSCQWVTDLTPLKTNYIKEYLTDAPYLIAVFKSNFSFRDDGRRKNHYYNEISVGVACGILLSAFQAAGLSSILTRPLCCGQSMRTLLNRPESEKLVFLVPVGQAIENCKVPDLKRKHVDEIIIKY